MKGEGKSPKARRDKTHVGGIAQSGARRAAKRLRVSYARAEWSREVEKTWLQERWGELLSQYAGQWLVVEGTEIVTSGHDFLEVVDRARSKGVAVPYAVKIPPAEEQIFIGAIFKGASNSLR